MTARILRMSTLVPITALVITAACGHDEAQRVDSDFQTHLVSVAEVEGVTESRPIEVRGTVHPARQATVSSRVMGPVVALMVRAGATVAKGQTLLEIQPEASEGQLAQTRGALAQASAGLALAERNHQRFKALHAENAASELELDMAKMQYEQARGAVAQAEGAVRSASSVAKESAVRAPFAARVVETLVEVGDLAAPGRPLVRVESTEGQQIWLAVREADIRRVALDQQIDVFLDARPDLGRLTGHVHEIVPSADSATHTFAVKVGLEDIHVPSGLSGRAIILGDASDRLLAPAAAIHHRGGLELVVVRTADGTARTRAVTTGRAFPDDRIEILSGLNAGEMVVTDAPGPVADGTPLEVRR